MFWILLLSLFLRLINLNQSLWLDEALQFKSIYYFSLKDLLTVYLPGDFNPPLSYLVNFFFSRIFGYSEIALRLPSVIFGVLTVWLVYKLSRGKIWPALLLATSGLHIYYSQEARMYSLAALAVTASFWFLLKKRWFWYGLFSLMAIYTHYLTVFIFPAQLIYILISHRQLLKKMLLSWLAVALGFLPWLPIFLQQLKGGQTAVGTNWGNVVGSLTLKNILLIPVKFLIGRISLDNKYLYALLISVPLILIIYLFYKTIHHWRKNIFLLSWLFIPLILIILFSIKLPVLSYFRLLFLLPAFYLLIANYSKKIIYFYLGLNLVCSAVYLFNPAFHREDWKNLVKKIGQGEPVLIIPAVNAPLKYYYAGEVFDDVPSVSKFWYIPYAEPIFDPGLSLRQKIIDAGFQEIQETSFRPNLTLIQYKR
ncbi:MAG: glycosyltransferase family 39 protein [Candidatus Beckwithbacteria bacterium]|nr:glycosyltransferase family 39 protein [Candidatus Beckwithbacteria bacterium]